LTQIFSIFSSPPPSSVTANIVCTDCMQETYNLLAPVTSAGFTSYFQTECGASFVGGATPTDITPSANTAVITGS
jgi:hypothetical protein